MTNQTKSYLEYVREKKHHQFRQNKIINIKIKIPKDYQAAVKKVTECFIWNLDNELPIILPNEKIAFTRTLKTTFSAGDVSNNCPDYKTTILYGLEQKRKFTLERLKVCKSEGDSDGIVFLNAIIKTIDAIERLCDRYAEEAKESGNDSIVKMLKHIPRYGARTFHEALQFLRILQFVVRCDNNTLAPIGRFDQYMYSFLKSDIEKGILNYDTAYELLLNYFISLNKDTDLYVGVQKGDNGQSIVLGGVDKNGKDAFNILSEMCLKASEELGLIDPKINLRVGKNTKLELYELGTQLTKRGLGFPQYCNDDIVIPGLVSLGYELEDARNYAVAACWEYIIPNYGMEIVNIDAISFPRVVNTCLYRDIEKCKNFNEFMECINKEIQNNFNKIVDEVQKINISPSPLQSILSLDAISQAKDISICAKYNNMGIHGAGLANASNSLAVIKKYIFETKELTTKKLIDALDNNFDGYETLQKRVLFETPKMGNNDDYVDDIAILLLDSFSEIVKTRKNVLGGGFRAGTGSAMYYISYGESLGATPDGRKSGEPLSANYSPSLETRVNGPISVIKSFTKPDLRKIINGGPLTIELHDSVFRNGEGIKKVAMLVKSYIDMGGHQLQLNAINRETLLDAQKNPEKYKNLIVRVWGWSGYFVELDKQYQNHIIKRVEMIV